MLSFGLDIALREPTLRPFLLLAFAVTLYSFLAAPVLASLVARLLTGERDFHADGEAMLLTRNAGALARALTASMDPSVPKVAAGPATAHLWFAPPIPKGGDWWRAFSGASSPAERVVRIRQWGPTDVPRS
jgi:Zn-dependent protease with chaperone function